MYTQSTIVESAQYLYKLVNFHRGTEGIEGWLSACALRTDYWVTTTDIPEQMAAAGHFCVV